MARQGWVLFFCIFIFGTQMGLDAEAKAKQQKNIANPGPSITAFSPTGNISVGTKQVVASFNREMVKFGDLRDEGGVFTVECSAPGKPRWLNSSLWAYDFDADLPAGVSCKFTLKESVRTLQGEKITGTKVFQFATGGPKISEIIPYPGSRINEEQAFILILDSEVDPAVAEKFVYFTAEGIPERIPARLIEGGVRESILKSEWRFKREMNADWVKQKVIVLQPKRNFPQDKKATLTWPKEIAAKNGMKSTEDQTREYSVREAFSAHVSCERENPKADCLPFFPIEVRFTSEVSAAQAKRVVLKTSEGKVLSPEVNEINARKEESVSSVRYKGPWPPNQEYTVELPKDLVDDGDRPLVNSDHFPVKIRTAGYPPLAKFSAPFGIIEANGEKLLPVTTRNVDMELKLRGIHLANAETQNSGKYRMFTSEEIPNIIQWYTRVHYPKRSKSIFGAGDKTAGFEIPRKEKRESFEVIGIPLPGNGFYAVEIESKVLGDALLSPKERKESANMFVPAAALVTNMAVHWKFSKENAMAWVTTLDKGEPVAGAAVEVYDCSGKIRAKSTSDSQGIAKFKGLPEVNDLPACDERQKEDAKNDYWYYVPKRYFIVAKTAKDFSFALSDWNEGIQPWRFQLDRISSSEALLAHTVFDRSLLRAGETLHMKHFLRIPASSGFSKAKDFPMEAILRHDGSGQEYKLPLAWDRESMVAVNEWKIPVSAKLGNYQVELHFADKKKGEPRSVFAGTFQVQEFRLPVMTATIQLLPGAAGIAKKQNFDVNVRYLNGGAAANLPVKFRYYLKPKRLAFPDYPRVDFSNGGVKIGDHKGWEEPENNSEKPSIAREEASLDKSGSARLTAKLENIPDKAATLFTELEYSDASGETQTAANQFSLYPSENLVGVRMVEATHKGPKEHFTEFLIFVVDRQGKPRANAQVEAELIRIFNYSHRKRLVGGFYAYESNFENKSFGKVCSGATNSKGELKCRVETNFSGSAYLLARSKDAAGNISVANNSFYAYANNDVYFAGENSDRMDLIPDKKQYESGETAKLQVQMPFREATALVSVEREGIIDSFVARLSGKEPVVSVPIKDSYGPNIFVSVLAVRGRVGEAQATELVDLGKPAFKLGITKLSVGWSPFELKVKVNPERETYRVREKAKVRVSVRDSKGNAQPGMEVALAAVDEALLELEPNHSWDLLPAMMHERGYGVVTSTAAMQVIGKRHYGLKALPQGGGGGRSTTRELFDTLLFWQARLKLDAKGEALVDVPLNDSLTSFRIVAVASQGLNRFGTGSASIRSTQDIQLISSIAPLAREGDSIHVGFLARNASNQKHALHITGKIEETGLDFPAVDMELASGEAREISWKVDVPRGKANLTYVVEAKSGAQVMDRLRVVEKIEPVIPVGTIEAKLAQVSAAEPLALAIARPKDAEPARGGIRVGLKAKIAENLPGVESYMELYPYSCLEQQLSKAIVRMDKQAWQKIVDILPNYIDERGLVSFFPLSSYSNGEGNIELTAYMLTATKEAGWEIPKDLQAKMLQGLENFVMGKIASRRSITAADLTYRKLIAMDALAKFARMEERFLSTIRPTLMDWPNSALLHWYSALLGTPEFKSRAADLLEAERVLRTRLRVEGTVEFLQSKPSDYLWWLLSSRDADTAALLLTVNSLPNWREDMPKLVNGFMRSQERGAWSTTIANAWAVLALRKFSHTFEKEKVSGKTQVKLAGEAKSFAWEKKNETGGSLDLQWPAAGEGKLSVEHSGSGRPWAVVESRAAIDFKQPIGAGISVSKTLLPLEVKTKGIWSRGDLVRVELKIHADSNLSWVVVSDPIPAGASILGGAGKKSIMNEVKVPSDASSKADATVSTSGWDADFRLWSAFKERSFSAYREYFEFMPRGDWVVSYTIRLNNAGRLKLPPTRVEAMYYPEVFSTLPSGELEVK